MRETRVRVEHRGFRCRAIIVANLIRTIIAQAASRHGVQPRSISFKGTVQTLEAFPLLIAFQGERNSTHRQSLYQKLL